MRPRPFPLLFLLSLCISLMHSSRSALAQAVDLSWAHPERVPGLRDSGLDPIILTDSEGTIHLFNSQFVGDTLSIFYIRWTLKEGWSTLVDIITSPQGGARVYGVHLDQQGWMHLVFFGGDDLGANMFYTKAPAKSAGKSTSWSTPVLIGEAAITPSMAAMAGDGKGFLTVLYSGDIHGNGLYTLHSLDGGRTWSSPRAMFSTHSDRLWPLALKMHVGEENTIYAVWSVADDTGNGQAVYFSKYSHTSVGWSRPIIIAQAIDYEADTPSIIQYLDELILIHHNDRPTTHWMYRSSDGGETWTSPIRLFEQVGGNGPVSMTIDSNKTLHMLFGNRVDRTGIHAIWYSRWVNDRWTYPEAIVSSLAIPVGPNGEEGFDPAFIQAIVIRGNLLFTIWRHDPRAGPTNIWYSYRVLDTPQIPYLPLPKPDLNTTIAELQPTPTTLPISLPALSDTPMATSAPKDTSVPVETVSSNPNYGIFIGVVPVVIILLIIIVVQRRRA